MRVGQLSEYFDVGVRWGERASVLQELCNKVGKVGSEVSRNGRAIDIAELHSAVVRNLGRSSANYISNGDRLTPTAWGLLTSENQEVLRVTSHAGREVIQAEEVLEGVGIGLLTLQVVDELELTVEEVLVSATEANESTSDVLATKLRLASCKIHRSTLHGIQRARELGEFVVTVNLKGWKLR